MTTIEHIGGATVKIMWQRCCVADVFDHEIHYEAEGIGSDGMRYSATWVEVDGHFSEIIDIEL